MANLTLAQPSLAELAKAINHEHEECKAGYQRGLEKARSCGSLLAAAKEQCRHGQWLSWLAENCPGITSRCAQYYMSIARDWGLLIASTEIGDLTLKNALQLLTAGGEEEESELVEAELLDPEPAPAPELATASPLHAGDRPIVRNPGGMFDGQQVEILEQQSGFYIAKTPDGNEYPFLPAQLEITSDCAQPEKTAVVRLDFRQENRRLRELLSQIYQAFGGHLPGELLAAIEAEIQPALPAASS